MLMRIEQGDEHFLLGSWYVTLMWVEEGEYELYELPHLLLFRFLTFHCQVPFSGGARCGCFTSFDEG